MRSTLFIFLLCSCSGNEPTPAEQAQDYVKPLLFGHRGTPLFRPENTVPAFDYAFQNGADGIELDVRRSKDGTLVVMHDRTVDRTSDGEGDVSTFTLEQLAALDAGSWFHSDYTGTTIPTLKQVIDRVPQRALFVIDVKSTGAAEDIASFIVDHDLDQRAWVASVNADHLRTVNETNSDIPLVWWIPTLDDLDAIDNDGIRVIRIPKSIESDPANIDRVLDSGFEVAISGSFLTWKTRFALVNNMSKTVSRREDRKPKFID